MPVAVQVYLPTNSAVTRWVSRVPNINERIEVSLETYIVEDVVHRSSDTQLTMGEIAAYVYVRWPSTMPGES